ncbi:hypothetical protein AC249_AIPGENE19913 [Exaiptasia diaphana]|nr:hypothetical protein AC249_AIPGENE19913 [Exaiptasia diaphana]
MAAKTVTSSIQSRIRSLLFVYKLELHTKNRQRLFSREKMARNMLNVILIEKVWDDSPETFCEAEASNRFTFRLEISALPCYPDN